MHWAADKRAGFALGALLGDDRDISVTRAHMPADECPEAERLLARVSGEAPGEKARAVRALVLRVRPPLADVSRLPTRARSLLARALPRELGREALASAPAPRGDFESDALLLALLERIARHGAEDAES